MEKCEDCSILKDIDRRLTKIEQYLQNSVEIDYDLYSEEFSDWIFTQTAEDSAKQYIRDLDKTISGKVIDDPSEIAKIFDDKPRHYRTAVRNFMRFLIQRGYFKASELADYQNVVKLEASKPRLNELTETEKILEALRKVNETKELMIKLLAYSGIRLKEGVLLFNYFDENKINYRGDVAFYDMKDITEKKLVSKNATQFSYVAFMPTRFANELREKLPMNVNEGMFKGDRLAKKIIYAKQLRKWFSYHIKKEISEKQIELRNTPDLITNFMQGHVVLSTVYQNPQYVDMRFSHNALTKNYSDLIKDAVNLYSKMEFPF